MKYVNKITVSTFKYKNKLTDQIFENKLID